MPQQTAVEWLIKCLFDFGKLDEHTQGLIEQAKQMEKEQIIHAWREGDNDSMYDTKELDQQAEQYYNETFTSTPPAESPSAIRTGQS